MEGGHNVPPPLPKTYILKMPLYGHNPLIVREKYFVQNFGIEKKIIYKEFFFEKNAFLKKKNQKSHRGGTMCPPPRPDRVKPNN